MTPASPSATRPSLASRALTRSREWLHEMGKGVCSDATFAVRALAVAVAGGTIVAGSGAGTCAVAAKFSKKPATPILAARFAGSTLPFIPGIIAGIAAFNFLSARLPQSPTPQPVAPVTQNAPAATAAPPTVSFSECSSPLAQKAIQVLKSTDIKPVCP